MWLIRNLSLCSSNYFSKCKYMNIYNFAICLRNDFISYMQFVTIFLHNYQLWTYLNK